MIGQIFFLSLLLFASVERYTYAGAITDQAIPPKGFAKWDSSKSQVRVHYKDINDSDQSLDIFLTRDKVGSVASTIFGKSGKITGAKEGHMMPGAFWIEDVNFTEGKITGRVCNSLMNIITIVEKCVTLESEKVINASYMGADFLAKVGLEKFYFNHTNPGKYEDNPHGSGEMSKGGAIAASMISAGLIAMPIMLGPMLGAFQNAIKVHETGYVYQLYNDECPYLNSTAKCIITDKIDPRYKESNNCKLLKANLQIGCTEESYCPCEGDLCDDQFNLKSASEEYKNASYDIRRCYSCNAQARLAYSKCVDAISNRDPEIYNYYQSAPSDKKAIIEQMYGPGSYACGFMIGMMETIRIGCMKVPLATPPRFFPRIARADINMNLVYNPAAHMFRPSAFVREFRDVDVSKEESCPYGPKEIGERARGTFFKPKIIVALQASERIITFQNHRGTTDMASLYGPTVYIDSKTWINSPWNEQTPTTIYHAKYTDDCQPEPVDTNISINVCTRIEYDVNNSQGFYAAYQASGVSTGGSCQSLDGSGQLVLLGRVPRPPLKYSFNGNTPLVPISIARAITPPQGKIVTNTITVNPKLIPTDIPAYHDDLTSMNADVIPDFYDIKNDALEIDKNCAMLFGHKFCVTRDPCTALLDISPTVKSDPTCTTTECMVYRNSLELCLSKTSCPKGATDIDACKASNHLAALLQLPDGVESYQPNTQWMDESCISEGFEFAEYGERNSFNDFTNTYRYGGFGYLTHDYVVAYKNHETTGQPRKVFSMGTFDDDMNVFTIPPLPATYFQKHELGLIDKYLADNLTETGESMKEAYLGSSCDEACIKEKITIRQRTRREMSLCAINDMHSSDWNSLLAYPGPHDIYIPYRCQYLEFSLAGAGGGAWLRNENTWNKDILTGIIGNNQYTNRGASGGGGGYVKGTIDMRIENQDYLHFVIGKAGDQLRQCWGSNPPWGSSLFGFNISVFDQGFYGSTGSSISTPTGANYATASPGISFADQCGSIPSNITGGGTSIDSLNISLGDIYNDGSFVGERRSGHNGQAKEAGRTYWTQGGNGYTGFYNIYHDSEIGQLQTFDLKNQPITCPTTEIDNKDGTIILTNDHRANGGCCYGKLTSPSRPGGFKNHSNASIGGDGTGTLQPAKVKINDTTNKPQLTSPYNKILTGATQRDPQCTPSCPRINIKMNVNGTSMVCEYGSIMRDEYNVYVNNDVSDLQARAGGKVMPSKCVTMTGEVYVPQIDIGIVDCSLKELFPVQDSNRFYGLCAISNNRNDYIKDMVLADYNYFSGAGAICDKQADRCMVKSAEADGRLKVLKALTEVSRYARRCNAGGLWAKSIGLSIGQSALNISELPIRCPALDPVLAPYESSYSMNAIWPESEPNTNAEALQCVAGYIPDNNATTLERYCSLSGLWQGTTAGEVCLYSCQDDIDTANNITWEAPVSYSNPVSYPKCLQGIATIKDDQGVEKTFSIDYEFPTGKTSADFVRTCNMPSLAISDIVRKVSIGPNTTDQTLLPKWQNKPSGSSCIKPSFMGNYDSTRKVFYLPSSEGKESIGQCQTGYIYTINGIPANPPSKKINGGVAQDFVSNNVNIKASYAAVQCKMSKTSSSSLAENLPFTLLEVAPNTPDYKCTDLTLKTYANYTRYSNDKPAGTYERGISSSLGAASTASVIDIDPKAAIGLRSNIITDRALKGENCTLEDTDKNFQIIERELQVSDHCSKLCFEHVTVDVKSEEYGTEEEATRAAADGNLLLFDCDELVPSYINECIPICHSNPVKWYYSPNLKFQTIDPQQTIQWSIDAKNSDKCIGNGLPQALIKLRTINLLNNTRVGNYCTSVIFEALAHLKNKLMSVPTTLPELGGQFEPLKKDCHIPKNCIIPGLNIEIPHSKEKWIVVADENNVNPVYKFTFSSEKDSTQCPIGNRYVWQANNLSLFKMYCSDGTLLQAGKVFPLNYSLNDDQTCNISSPSKIEHITNTIKANTNKILAETDFEIAEVLGGTYTLDNNHNMINYYLGLSAIESDQNYIEQEMALENYRTGNTASQPLTKQGLQERLLKEDEKQSSTTRLNKRNNIMFIETLKKHKVDIEDVRKNSTQKKTRPKSKRTNY